MAARNKNYPKNPSGNPMHRGTYVAPPIPRIKPPGKPPLTPEQWAEQQAQKYIDAQVKAIQEQQRIYLEELRRQAQLRAEQGRALAQWLQAQNFPGRIQGIYGTAASDVAGYAKGFSGDIRDIATQGAAEQANMLSGTGQEGAVRNEGEGMGNVMYGAYGYVPAQSFTTSGAAFASDAALQPAFASQQAAVEAAKIQQEGLGALVDFAKAIAEAKGGKFGLKQDLLGQRQKNIQDQREWAYKQAMDDRDYWLKMQALYMSQGRYKLAQDAAKRADEATRRANNASAGLDYWGKPKPGYHRDPKTGRVVKDKKPGSGANWGQIQKDMAKEDLTITETSPPTRIGNITVPGEEVTRKMTYKEAFGYLMSVYGGLVKDKGRLRRLINKILAQKGIKKPPPPDRSLDPNGPENPGR